MTSSGNATTTDDGTPSPSTTITEEERELFASLGLSQLLEEGSSANLSEPPPSTDNNKQLQPLNTHVAEAPSFVSQPLTALTGIRHYFFPPKQDVHVPSPHPTKDTVDEMGVARPTGDAREESGYNPLIFGLGAAFLFPHLMVLLSLPPSCGVAALPTCPPSAESSTPCLA